MTTVTQTNTQVKQQWIAVSLPFAWGFEDSANAASWARGFQYFTGPALTEYLKGWNAGLQIRIERIFGWQDASRVDAAERRAAIIAMARGAGCYLVAKTAQDAAARYDKELYASWPAAYRAERFQVAAAAQSEDWQILAV